MMTRLLISIAVAVLAGSAFGQNGALAPDKMYLIGPSDEITGKVLGESQFDFVVIVDED